MSQQQTFFHNVFFWLADPDTARQVADGCQRLAAIPGIVRLTVGFPSGKQYGPVDGTYGVALLIEFEGSAAHDAYETHPDHVAFVEEFGPQFSRVVVYDVEPAV